MRRNTIPVRLLISRSFHLSPVFGNNTSLRSFDVSDKRDCFHMSTRYAQYSRFKIYSEAEYYKLEIDGYDGNAGDSLNDPWYGSNNSPFSTYNRQEFFLTSTAR